MSRQCFLRMFCNLRSGAFMWPFSGGCCEMSAIVMFATRGRERRGRPLSRCIRKCPSVQRRAGAAGPTGHFGFWSLCFKDRHVLVIRLTCFVNHSHYGDFTFAPSDWVYLRKCRNGLCPKAERTVISSIFEMTPSESGDSSDLSQGSCDWTFDQKCVTSCSGSSSTLTALTHLHTLRMCFQMPREKAFH